MGLAGIMVLGISAQWIAWRTRIPSILILLSFGFLAGPIGGYINPKALLGDMFFPVISLLVSIIVFEGGSSLRVADLKKIGKPVRNIVIFGTLMTFGIISVASYYILGFNQELAVMFGAMMVITGPTVIVPLLRHVNLEKEFSSLIRWEGILIAPVGAVLIVMVYQYIFATSGLGKAAVIITVLKTLGIGAAIGVGLALLILVMIRKNWVPDFLQEVMALMFVICCYTVSNVVQPDSGIIAVVVMGLVLANQNHVVVRHILVFKENLRILAISMLFIILSGSLAIQNIYNQFDITSVYFLLVLFLLARPIPIFISTIGTTLNIREKLFLCCMAPRGIVTASIASLFALRLVDRGVPGAEALEPMTFIVIIATVSIYGGFAEKVQAWLKLSLTGNGDIFIVGAHDFARKFAKALTTEGIPISLVDSNKNLVITAKQEGLTAYHSNIMSKTMMDEIRLANVADLLAMTPSDEVNMLTVIQYAEILGRDNVYRLIPDVKELENKDTMKKFDQGHFLFGRGNTYNYLSTRIHTGAEIKVIEIGDNFNFEKFRETHGERTVLLANISKDKKVSIYASGQEIKAEPGSKILVLQ